LRLLRKEEGAEGWRIMHNEEPHDLYDLPHISAIRSTRMRWVGFIPRIRNAYKILVRKPEWMKPFRRPKCRWKINIRKHLGEIGWEGVDWIHLA
jgi:hypothetical protein